MITVIGGGLAGSEAALQIAKRGFEVNLYEMRPITGTGAHKTDFLGELVCSNSLGSNDLTGASGLLKEELRMLGSFLMKFADESKVLAGNALAVDRDVFGKKITEAVNDNPKINIIREELKTIPDTPTIIASGPLTSEELSKEIAKFTDKEHLYFFDAISPIIEKDSINFDIAFLGNRYGKGEGAYINCPMNKEEYDNFYNILINAPRIELKEFEKNAKFFESCMPVEQIASRGVDTLRFGPMKPVGFTDPRTGERPYAIVQLRQDNLAASLYNIVGFQTNLKWGAQKELVQSIPGMENAEIHRYGVMHRNTFIQSPYVLNNTMQTKKRADLFFAGQLTGVEGYTESIATGLLAGINMANHLQNKDMFTLDDTNMLGALTNYITFEGHKKIQPINSNWGIVKSVELPKKERKNKKLKAELRAKRAVEYLKDKLGCSISK